MINQKKISIITPCFNEEAAIAYCYETVKHIFETQLGQYTYEHIFSDNASTDNTVPILRKIAEVDPRVKILVNSRNFGPMRSNFNGVLHATGDAVFVFLPADLQDPPDLMPEFIKKWEEGFQVVYGIRHQRQEARLMIWVRRLYYNLVASSANITIVPNVGDFQLVDKQVLNELKKVDDYYPYLRGLIFSCGFRSVGIKYTWIERKRGVSKNRILSLIDQGLNGLISFTNLPMRLCMFTGFIVAFLSVMYGLVQLVLNVLFYREFSAPGIATLIVALFFFSGIQLFFLGIIGEYASAIHFQVRKRPMVIVKEKVNFD